MLVRISHLKSPAESSSITGERNANSGQAFGMQCIEKGRQPTLPTQFAHGDTVMQRLSIAPTPSAQTSPSPPPHPSRPNPLCPPHPLTPVTPLNAPSGQPNPLPQKNPPPHLRHPHLPLHQHIQSLNRRQKKKIILLLLNDVVRARELLGGRAAREREGRSGWRNGGARRCLRRWSMFRGWWSREIDEKVELRMDFDWLGCGFGRRVRIMTLLIHT